MNVVNLAAGHPVVALDANVLIYVLEGAGPKEVLRDLIGAIEDGTMRATLASVGLAEILGMTSKVGDAAVFEAQAAEIRSIPNLFIARIDAEVATDAAWISGQAGVALMDAIHLASARAAKATAFITNDRGITSIPNLEVIQLSDLEAA